MEGKLRKITTKPTKELKILSGGKKFIANLKAFAIFFAALLIIDMVLFVVVGGSVDRNYAYIVLSDMFLAGILQFLYIRFDKKGLYAAEVIIALILIFTIVELMLYKTYGIFMPPGSAINNAKNVTEHYSDELVKVVANNMTFIIRFLIFYAAILLASNEYLIKKQEKKSFDSFTKEEKKIQYAILITSVVLFVISFLSIDSINDFTYNVQKNGVKAAFIRSFYKSSDNIKLSSINENEFTPTIKDDALEKYNAFNIDYKNLDVGSLDERCKNINEYVASRKPSKKNEYTGIFKGKNLILICAEAYSHYVINKELTPTLYRLTNNGFKFTDYYAPSWGGSTTSGEFAFLTGLIPSDAAESMKNTIGKNMCFTMPRVLKNENYSTCAYHNGIYKFYNRNMTHRENMGFDDYIACGNGLEEITGEWPSDEIMIEKTFESYRDKKPFCVYYMTISGHAFYNNSEDFKVTKSIKKVKEVYGDKYPEQVNNYICYQIYLEEALSKLVQSLEERNMLDDTVICMTTDHFPYGLNSEAFTDGVDYIPYLYENFEMDEFDQDKSMPILWCGSLENEHKDLVKTIDTPTSSIDLLPTLLNLFGARYDSRLIAGRDVFSDEEPFVVYNSGAFVTDKGRFSKLTNRFKSYDGTNVEKEYIEEYKEKARNLILFSQYVVTNNYYDYIFTNNNISEEYRNSVGTVNMDVQVKLEKKDYEHFVEYFKKCNEEYISKRAALKEERENRDKQDKVVYLTFDDGPNNYYDKILKALSKNNIKATFFVVGTAKEKELKKIKEEGHTIGLHSASHNYSYIYRSEKDYLWDLYELQDFVYQVTGEYSHYIRFPGGSKNRVSDEVNSGIMDKLRPLVEDLGFEYYDWHVATGDSSERATREHILSSVERGLQNDYDELIILMHDLHSVTVESIDDVVKLCKGYGYRFDKITDMTIPFHSIGVN